MADGGKGKLYIWKCHVAANVPEHCLPIKCKMRCIGKMFLTLFFFSSVFPIDTYGLCENSTLCNG